MPPGEPGTEAPVAWELVCHREHAWSRHRVRFKLDVAQKVSCTDFKSLFQKRVLVLVIYFLKDHYVQNIKF